MAGFLTFLPLYARQVGLDDAGLPLALYALVVVGLRIAGATWPDRFGAVRLSGTALAHRRDALLRPVPVRTG